ncbi:MAG: cupin [Sulfurimonas sp.]|nr:MAG: cupin [Sulfurimonas sp.]
MRHNLFSDLLPCPRYGESFETLLSCKNVTIERIVSVSFHNGEWMEQDHDEWVVLLQGDAILEIVTTQVTLRSGDYRFIASRTPHRVVHTSPQALWLAVHIT